ncbi:hypothetical protein GIB67_022889 [Kingdonia uniflora]|uniref:Transmembrane protein n=1 Tax=Kingdonia uniflora TaxID=39325 RepID=A0A7J7MWR4_9MAGN|nr:hypothetical protein GIB67_022889 [Kingdonia uniflora]
MLWFSSDRRGPDWKQGWTDQTLSSISIPPLPLLTVFAIVLLFMFLSKYTDYSSEVRQSMINFQIFLFLLPTLLILILQSMPPNGKFVIRIPLPEHESIHKAGNSPWGVAILVVVLLVMIFYQSSFHSQWFRPLWRSN